MDLSAEVMGIIGEGFDPETSPVSDYEELKDGTYDVAVEKVEFKESKNTGNYRFQINFEILNGESQGRKFFGMLSLSEKKKTESLTRLIKYSKSCLISSFLLF